MMTLTPFQSQKSVVCDEPSSSGGQSTLVAYLGGIDLTDGRYLQMPSLSAQILLRHTGRLKKKRVLAFQGLDMFSWSNLTSIGVFWKQNIRPEPSGTTLRLCW